MRRIPFTTVDVFTDRRFAGNPLAVMTDARGLDAAEMQAIAAEFGYSEVTFVLPPENPANTARVRIFTPTTEVPFAGHPNVGTALVLAGMDGLFGRPLGQGMRFEEAAGLVDVTLLTGPDGTVTAARIAAPEPLSVGESVAPALVAACCGLPAEAIRCDGHAPVIVSVGLPFAVAEIADLDRLGRARPQTEGFLAAEARHPGKAGPFSLFLYARTGDNTLRARMFAPLDDVPEDPATGSASAALSAYLARLAPEADLHARFEILQGVEMGRPSRIAVTVDKRDGEIAAVHLEGGAVPVMEGTIRL